MYACVHNLCANTSDHADTGLTGLASPQLILHFLPNLTSNFGTVNHSHVVILAHHPIILILAILNQKVISRGRRFYLPERDDRELS
jgi:hypothetical protein